MLLLPFVFRMNSRFRMKVARILAREREEVLTDFPGVGVIRGGH